MESHNMVYNSQTDNLVIPEYGRNVQKMIQFAQTVEDPELRQAYAEKIVELMFIMNPQSKNVADYKIKLWHHMFKISNYELDVVAPDGFTKSSKTEIDMEKPPYPDYNPSFRHYGNFVKQMISKALEIEDQEKREGYIEAIGSYMKLAYKTWNREHYVSDKLIKDDLKAMTDGKIALPDDFSLDFLSAEPTFTRGRSKQPQGRRGKGKGKGNNRNRNKKRSSRRY